MKNKILLGSGVAVAALIMTVATSVQWDSTTSATDQASVENQGIYVTMTPEMIEADQKAVKKIYTKKGVFVRTETKIDVPADQEVFDVTDITNHTKQVVLKHGVYVRE